MRKSWRLRQINERVDAQRCLLKQRVWSCDVVSKLRIQLPLIHRFLLSSCIFELRSRLGLLIRAIAMLPASSAGGMRRRLGVAVLGGCLRHVGLI